MHLGTGEEAIVAGVLAHLQEDDALALDHRSTPPLVIHGVDLYLILRELLGCEDGLCGGKGGHMHLFSKEHLAASSGIVGSAGPTAAGFALAAQQLRPGTIAVAFFGEGAMNQGMLLESMNLAAAWHLPLLFVCKDDNWSISTNSEISTGGTLIQRARGLGLETCIADGRDVDAVWRIAQKAISKIRNGHGPIFLHAQCVHLEAHFLGFKLVRVTRNPFYELPGIVMQLIQSLIRPGGAPPRERIAGLKIIFNTLLATWRDTRRDASNDPIIRTRTLLGSDPNRLEELEMTIQDEINAIISTASLGVRP
jgi:pyruvate dehydrogenase E1 component alpha subunit